jgi:NDP-sugar pyrophosphorylase family protein
MASKQEFQVILFAGGLGNRMYPLTEEIPKVLLPVANRPLISYQLEFLERAGFSGTIMFIKLEILVRILRAFVSFRLYWNIMIQSRVTVTTRQWTASPIQISQRRHSLLYTCLAI